MYPRIDTKATGTRLRRMMKQKNMTVRDVQEYLGLSCVQSIYRWLAGRSMPSIDHLYALSELFQMPVDDMIAGNRRWRIMEYDLEFGPAFGKRTVAYYKVVEGRRAA